MSWCNFASGILNVTGISNNSSNSTIIPGKSDFIEGSDKQILFNSYTGLINIH